MDECKLDKQDIVAEVCRAFAYQMHIDGLFNGDPHPGTDQSEVM